MTWAWVKTSIEDSRTKTNNEIILIDGYRQTHLLRYTLRIILRAVGSLVSASPCDSLLAMDHLPMLSNHTRYILYIPTKTNAIPSSSSSPKYIHCRHDTGRVVVVGHVGKEHGHGEEVGGGHKVFEVVQYTRASSSGARKLI